MAPWALAAGLLVSFTASASNGVQSGFSFAARSPVARLTDTGLVPPIGMTSGLSGRLDLGRDILRTTPRYDLPDEATLKGEHLRGDMKAGAGAYPAVDRALKGGRAAFRLFTLSERAREIRTSLTPSGSRILFNRNENLLPPTILMEGKLEGPEMEQKGFEPWQAPELTTTRQATSIQSPAAAAAGSTGAAAGSTTPFVKRAIVLSSTTPAPADATPIEIAAAPVSRIDKNGSADTTIVARTDDERPRYADLIDPDNLSKEQRCLAEAVYFEARSESEDGQAAVAQVVLNRVKSGLYPSSICGVVYQNRHRHLACQFTFACEGKALRVTESEPWDRAKRIASAVLEGRTYLADVGGATHYHADYVKPYWARRLKKMDVIGRHIFYKLRPGQT
ncbi:cell wall hydrolase [Microvirga sp. 2TAF3]|uniref:cell wall hydrolase n=1 Tax=Microvirga sp. 2TAF3 TaxID=3233014 RepID=UPI003F9B3DE0